MLINPHIATFDIFMYSQAPFSQGNAATWKEAICSKTIRLTLFSSRLLSKRKTRLCLSEETKCRALKMQNSFTGTLRIPAAKHGGMLLVTGESRLPELGVQQVFPSLRASTRAVTNSENAPLL